MDRQPFKHSWFILFLIPLIYSSEGSGVLQADSKIPAGQGVGARQRDFELQKHQEMIKRKLNHQKKKSKIENLTQNNRNNNRKKGDDESTE